MHPCTDQALNLCMSRESYRTSKSTFQNWKWIDRKKNILQASILEFHVYSPVLRLEMRWTWMKLEVVSKHVPVRHFVDSNPSLHKNTPCCSCSTGFSADSSSSSLWENERVKYNTCLVPGLTKLIGWWQFNVQRASKDDHAKTLATGFTVQALWHPLSGWNLDINILKISAIAPATKDGTIPRGSFTKAFILEQAASICHDSSSATLREKDEVWRTPPLVWPNF